MKRLVILVLATVFLVACEEDKKNDAPSVVPVKIPSIVATCRQADINNCAHGTPVNLTGKKGVVLMADAANTIQAIQLGTMTCGDQGGALGVSCFFTTSDAGWLNAAGESISEIPAGVYAIQFLVDVNGDLNSLADMSNIKGADGDAICFMNDVVVTADMGQIGRQNFKCVFAP